MITKPDQQQGSALILAILVAGIVAVLAVQFAQAFVLQSSRLENRLLHSRFETYMHGAEVLAAQVLLTDNSVSEIDHLQEPWAMMLPPLATDDGWLQVRLSDAQGRFNLNNLALKTPYFNDLSSSAVLRFSPAQKQFIRLLQGLRGVPVSESEAVQIVEAIVDWLDSDDTVSGAGGAESLYYMTLTPSYQPANQFFVDTSELRLVRHLSPDLIQQLQPFIVVLPEFTSLNLNTAGTELLATVNRSGNLEPLLSADIERVLAQREQRAFDSVAEAFDTQVFSAFKDELELAVQLSDDVGPDDATIPPVYSVSSDYFVLDVSVIIGDQQRTMQSMLKRTDTDVITVARHHGL